MSLPTLTMRLREATETGHFTEFLYDDGSNDEVLVCAVHGGRIEPVTGEQAIELTSRLETASCWGCLGYDEEAEEFDQWHPTSTDITADDYPLLKEIADRRFEIVISLHGLGNDKVLVGGDIDPGIKQHVRDRLAKVVTHPVETVSEGPYGGTNPDNFVNWLAREGKGGLQLEQSRTVRDNEGDVVTTVLEHLVTENVL